MTNDAILIGGPLDGEPRTFAETGYPPALIVSGTEWSHSLVYERTDRDMNGARIYRYREPPGPDEEFWLTIRDSLVMIVGAIEDRIGVGGDRAV